MSQRQGIRVKDFSQRGKSPMQSSTCPSCIVRRGRSGDCGLLAGRTHGSSPAEGSTERGHVPYCMIF
eukprot:190686-Prymnesium_polylepis.3